MMMNANKASILLLVVSSTCCLTSAFVPRALSYAPSCSHVVVERAAAVAFVRRREFTSSLQLPATADAQSSAAAAAETSSDKESTATDQAADTIFSIIDVDGSGTVSLDELTEHLTTAGYTGDVIAKLFSNIDADSNGEISKSEFRNGFAKIVALQSAPGLGNYNAQFQREICEDADALFAGCDADGNGRIDVFELQSHMGRKFSKYSKEAIANIFDALDLDGNGTISKGELRDAFVRFSAVRQALGEGPNFK